MKIYVDEGRANLFKPTWNSSYISLILQGEYGSISDN